MSECDDRFEHLMTRCLDGEASPAERGELEARLRDDSDARALFDQTQALDALAGRTVRVALADTRRTPLRASRWARVGRALVLATAACLAAFAWLKPNGTDTTSTERPAVHAGMNSMASWFAPAHPPQDVIELAPRSYERPELRVRGGEREWIVLPGAKPGQFVVIEVERVRTHVIGLHQDF